MQENNNDLERQVLKNRAVTFIWAWGSIDTTNCTENFGWLNPKVSSKKAPILDEDDEWNEWDSDDMGGDYFDEPPKSQEMIRLEHEETKRYRLEDASEYGTCGDSKEQEYAKIIKNEDFQYLLTPCEENESKSWGLYRVDIALNDDNKCSLNHYQDAFNKILDIHNAQPVEAVIDPKRPIKIDLELVKVVDKTKEGALYQSCFLLEECMYELSLTKDGVLQLSGLSKFGGGSDNSSLLKNKIDDIADEYAGLLLRIIKSGDVETSVRRIEHIRQSIDRHLPLIERLQAMQRRLEHDCHAFKRWWYQLRGKVGELSHIVVDSTYDLALELEQNSRRINKSIDQVLKKNAYPFMKWGVPYAGASGADRLVDYLASGGKYRRKILEHRQNINAQLEGDRAVLDKVSSLVDSSSQRSTNRALSRIQAWGSLLAVVAIFTGFIGNFALDGMGYLTDEILKSTYFLSFSILSFAGVILYAMSLLRREAIEERKKVVVRIFLSSSIIIYIYIRFYFNTTSSSWLQVNDMFEGIPLLYGITFFFVIFSAFLLLRQKDVQSWLTLRKDIKENKRSSGDKRRILRVISEINKGSKVDKTEKEKEKILRILDRMHHENEISEWVKGRISKAVRRPYKYEINKQDELSILQAVDRMHNKNEINDGGSLSILRAEGGILDIYEKISQKRYKSDTDADTGEIAKFKNHWKYLSEAMDAIDAGKHKNTNASGSFKGQVNSIRDEVLLARSVSQCILRLPEYIQGLKNKEVAEHVMLRANIDFDPMPNAEKIKLIHETNLLPAYLAPYKLNDYCSQYIISKEDRYWEKLEDLSGFCSEHIRYIEHQKRGDIVNELGEKVYAAMLESICLYMDIKVLGLIEKIYASKKKSLPRWRREPSLQEQSSIKHERVTPAELAELATRLQRHMPGEFVDFFLVFLKKTPFETLPQSIDLETIQVWIEKGRNHALITLPHDRVDLMARDIKRFVINRNKDVFIPLHLSKDAGDKEEYQELNKTLRVFVEADWVDVEHAYQKVSEFHKKAYISLKVSDIWGEMEQWLESGAPPEAIEDDLLFMVLKFIQEADTNEKTADSYRVAAKFMYEKFWDWANSPEELESADGFYNQAIDRYHKTDISRDEIKYKIEKNDYILANQEEKKDELTKCEKRILSLLYDVFKIHSSEPQKLDEFLCDLQTFLKESETTATSLKQQYDSILEKGLFETRKGLGATRNSPYTLKGEYIDVVTSLCALREYDDAMDVLDKLYSKFEGKTILNKPLLDKIKDFVSSKINGGGTKVGGI